MAARRKSDTKKPRGIFLKCALVVFAGYVVFSIFSTQIDIANKKAELAELEAKTEELRISNEEYRSLLESCGSDSYIERIARKKLDYVYPNERVYIDRSGK